MAVKHALFFVTMCVAGGVGGAMGSLAGRALGTGGVLIGGFVGGTLLIVGAGRLGERLGWIARAQRRWAVIGGFVGFVLAAIVALSTLSTPVGPLTGTLLIGCGALLGAVVGRSAHDPGLTPAGRHR